MIKVYFKTHGCSTNFSESEVMMGLLKQAQFEIVRKPDEANVLVINVCTVKGE
ncbi:tRNA (N6-isopentenyl adenosine(37)-C2)-methylthiotransferase MiaB, partial [Candidatus Woesearchaeota archaeon]|nr:tRNA (N6-isopentenyl adenosine(37)-C2)-methylthiotransferase MiaB [Candidatus Woesearchaeota archaeon]